MKTYNFRTHAFGIFRGRCYIGKELDLFKSLFDKGYAVFVEDDFDLAVQIVKPKSKKLIFVEAGNHDGRRAQLVLFTDPKNGAYIIKGKLFTTYQAFYKRMHRQHFNLFKWYTSAFDALPDKN